MRSHIWTLSQIRIYTKLKTYYFIHSNHMKLENHDADISERKKRGIISDTSQYPIKINIDGKL